MIGSKADASIYAIKLLAAMNLSYFIREVPLPLVTPGKCKRSNKMGNIHFYFYIFPKT